LSQLDSLVTLLEALLLFRPPLLLLLLPPSDTVRTVVTLSTQSYGAEGISGLKQDSSILLIHGTDDKVLPPYCSSYVYNLANDPKEIIFYRGGATHGLDEAAEQIHQTVHDWLVKHLKKAGL
jgi:fermentation-respiration switch protein FrsA (DUF1100 family)